jgi:type II secretory pathway pseudopilin PulG
MAQREADCSPKLLISLRTASPAQRHAVCIVSPETPTVTTRTDRGFALIDLIFVCGLIGILSAIAVPRLLLASQAAGSASAIGSMRAINSSELTYALTCGNGFYAPKLTTLGVAPPSSVEAFITPSLATGDTVMHSGYLVQLTAEAYADAPATCNGLTAGQAGRSFKASADPTAPGNVRFFATNAGGIIYEDVSSMFAAIPEVGDPPSGHPLR